MNRSLIAIAAASMLVAAAPATAQMTGAPSAAPSARADATSDITAVQRTRLNEKLRMAAAIVTNMEAGAAAQGSSPGWRQATLNTLYGLSNEQLAALRGVQSPNALPQAIVTAKRVATKALGDSDQDLVYTPITPCRYIDTRDVGGKITGRRSYDLDSNAYATSAGHCAASPYSTFGSTLGALAVNMAIFDTSNAPGVATIVPVGAAISSALVNWYQIGPSVQASNAAIVTNDQGPTLAEIDVYTSTAVHVIVDVFGGFRAPQRTALDCVSTFVENTAVAANAIFNVAIPACPTGYTITGAGCRTPGFTQADWAIMGLYKSSSTSPLDAFCSGVNKTAGVITVQGTAQCCRTPGRP